VTSLATSVQRILGGAQDVSTKPVTIGGRFALRFGTDGDDGRGYGYAIRRGDGGVILRGNTTDNSVVDHAAVTLRLLPR